MKRIFTRFVVGFFIALIVFVITLPFSAARLDNYISPPDEKTKEQVFLEDAISLYVSNMFHSGDSPAPLFDELKPYYRPEVLDAISKGVVDGIRRDDHDEALVSLYLDKFNEVLKKEYDQAKKKDKNAPPPTYYTRESITEVLSRYRSKGLFYRSIGAGLALLFAAAWIFFHDRIFSIVSQYKKGRLYNVLDAEIEKKDQLIEEQQSQIAHWKTKFNEMETAHNALDQKFRTFFNQLKEKEKAEKEAAEKAKKEKEKEKALEEKAKNAFS